MAQKLYFVISYRKFTFCNLYAVSMQITPEERQRRSELAKKLHAEGKFGGPGRGQGRPRNRRASEVAAEKISAEGEMIADRLIEIIREGGLSISRAAIMDAMKIEEQERSIAAQENEQINAMKRDELLAHVVAQLEALQASGVIPDVIEGTAVELGPDEPVVKDEDAGLGGTRQIAERTSDSD